MNLPAKDEIRGRHVLIMMLAFFGVIVAVDLVFAYLAISTFTGLDTENAYLKGLRYNETLQAAEAQQDLGWTVKLDHRAVDDSRVRVSVAIESRAKRPVEGLDVTALWRRPTHDGHDRSLDLRPMGQGRYEAEIEIPLRGQWNLRIEATGARGQRYIQEQRIWLK
jgi:nitrogen fixation protein FixH